MEKKEIIYSPEFMEVLNHCKEKKLYLGEGKPNAKILIVGKEVGGGNPKSLEEIIRSSDNDVKRNIETWTNPNGYDLNQIKTDIFNNGKNPTWNNYQKLVSEIIRKDLGKDNYNFLDYCFMTEFSQIHLPKSTYCPSDIDKKEFLKIKTESINKRKILFERSFFKNFPIIIMACGHYPTRDFPFDMQKAFNVQFEEEKSKEINNNLPLGYYCNLHYGKDRILIHTRQLSNFYIKKDVANKYLQTIGNLINNHFHTNPDFRWNNGGKEIYEKLQNNPDFEQSDEYKEYMKRLGIEDADF